MNKIVIALASVVVLVGVSLCLSSVTHPDAVAKVPSDSLQQVCESIVNHASRGERQSLDLTNANSAWQPTSALDKELQVARWQNQTTQLVDFQRRFGPFLGCELAEQKDLSDSLRTCVYIAKYEQNTMRWTFILYRPHDKWRILGIRFKDLMGDLFPQT
jgi:hypothetical protein